VHQHAPPASLRAATRKRTVAKRPSLRRDERGQMMLLAGFIFVIGLLVVSASLSRVPLLAKQVSRESTRPILAEVDPFIEGTNAALADLARDFRPAIDGTASAGLGPAGNGSAFDRAVRAMFGQLRTQEASRGIGLEWQVTCPASPGTTRAIFTLADGEMRVDVQSDQFRCFAAGTFGSWDPGSTLPAPAPPPPPPPPPVTCVPDSQVVAISLAASFSVTGGSGTAAWTSDGSNPPDTGTGTSYSATYATAGAYTVNVTRSFQTDSCAVTVSPGPVCLPANQAVVIGGSGSWTAVGGGGSYSWTSDGSDAPNTGSGASYAASYSTAGSYNVNVTDGTYSMTCVIAVEPTLTCAPATQDVGVDQDASFTAAGGSGTYAWSSPGSSAPTTGSGPTYTARYATTGTKTVTVTSGAQSMDCEVVVNSGLVCAPGTQEIGEGQSASFSVVGGSGSYDWESPGSDPPDTGTGSTYSAAYGTTGSYTVTVTSGALSDTCDVSVDAILDCAPASQTVGVDQDASFTATGGSGTYSWSSPGSNAPNAGTGAAYTASYPASGAKTVTITSGTQSASCAVTVDPLLVCSPATQTVGVGRPASFTATGGQASKSWASPSGSPASGSGATYSTTYAGTGSYTVTLTSGPQTDTCAVTVEPALTCSPASQNVATNQAASLSASGGTGSYSWSAPGGNPSTGTGSPYSVSYPGLGTYTVTLSSTYQTTTCTVVVNLYYTYVSDCEARTGLAANCPSNLGASDGSLAVLTEGSTQDATNDYRYGSSATKVSGTFNSGSNNCASAGSDTSTNARNAPDGVYACYIQKNDKLSVSGFTAADQYGRITKVEIAYKGKVTLDSGGSVTSNQLKLLYKVSGTQGATSLDFTLSTSDSTGYVDVTGDRTWSWTDITNTAVQGDAQAASNNKEHVNIDAFWIRVTVAGLDTQLRFTATGVPAATTQTLELLYSTTTDTFRVQLWDGTAWNSRGATLNSASQTAWTYTITAAEYLAGYPRIRIVDVTSGLGSPAGTVSLDYVRIASS